jgi:PAS domain S-box-containing protein
LEQKSVSRFAVFLSLALGFIILGFSGSYILFKGATDSYFNQVSQNLKSIAAMSALQIDPTSINKLSEPSQSTSPEFTSQTKILNNIIIANPQITHLSVLKAIGPQYYFVVDASSLGQKGSKSELLDPADDIPTNLTRAITEQAAVSSITPHEDRWGTWYSAYAPIQDAKGQTIAVVQVDADAKEITLPNQALLLQFKTTLALIIAVCIIMAWLASGPVTSGLITLKNSSNSPFGKSVIELALALIIIGIASDLGLAVTRQFHINNTAKSLVTIQSVIHQADAAAHSIHLGTPKSAEELEKLKTQFFEAKQGRLYDIILTLSNSKSPTDSDLRVLDSAMVQIEKRESNILNSLSDLQKLQSRSTSRALIGFLLVSFISIVLFRYAANQNYRIDRTVSTSNAIQAQLSSLVENLPVGLFVLESGKISFANIEFKNQVGNPSEDISLENLSESIHPDDRNEAIAVIKNSANVAKPFQTQYRISKSGAPTLHVETRGVPVYDGDGVCRRMLAFTVDFSAAVEAKHALEDAYGEVEHKNKLLSNALAELELNLESVVRALVKAVEAKDPYTAGHSERVMQYSMWLGEAIGLGPYEKRILELGTLVHDVGKIGIPDAILTKPDRLTEEEYDIIKKHPEYGVNIISDIEMFRECVPIVRWHHERLDGRGYPDQLKDKDIPLLVRISSIADIFDAMTSTRAYRTGMELEKVLNIMNDLSEKGEIDSDLFATFCQVIHQKGIISQQVQQEPWKAA